MIYIKHYGTSKTVKKMCHCINNPRANCKNTLNYATNYEFISHARCPPFVTRLHYQPRVYPYEKKKKYKKKTIGTR